MEPPVIWSGYLGQALDLPTAQSRSRANVNVGQVVNDNRGGFVWDAVTLELVIPRTGWYGITLDASTGRGNLPANTRAGVDVALDLNGSLIPASNAYSVTVRNIGGAQQTASRTSRAYLKSGDRIAVHGATITPNSATLFASLTARGTSLNLIYGGTI